MKGRFLRLTVLLCLATVVVVAAKDKPWTEWSKKDAQKILDNSPWGKTQVLTDSSKVGFSPTTDIGDISNAARLNYRIRFVSAKPIRLAFLRLAQLDPRTTPEQLQQRQDFVNMTFDEVIVIAVSIDSEQPRVMGAALRSFRSGVTSILASETYLQVKGRPRNYLMEYQPPTGDALGAKFVFARMVDGQPFIDQKSDSIRFYAKFPELQSGNNAPGGIDWRLDKPVELDWRFKVSDMKFEGGFEY